MLLTTKSGDRSGKTITNSGLYLRDTIYRTGRQTSIYLISNSLSSNGFRR